MASERYVLALVCPDCKRRNYYYFRGKKKDYKLEVNKFCRQCRKYTVHKETKAN